MNWLDQILEQHREYESPLPFYYWAGIAAISAVVKDNVWVDRGGLFKQYPNVMVILYADSGLKKGPPISMANQLVQEVNNTTIIYGRSSIQGIMKKMGQAESLPGGKVTDNSKIFICSSELAASIVDDPAALSLLTDLYDRIYHANNAYASLLKMEEFKIKNPTITLLGGINQAHASSLFSNRDIQGGFIARCFLVHETEENTINSLISKPEVTPNYKELAGYLKELAKLKGPFQELEGTEAGKIYHNWYVTFRHNFKKSGAKDPTGTINRFGESVMKVAMLASLAEKPELIISPEAMELAIKHCEKLIGNVRKTTLGSGKHSFAEEKALLIQELLRREPHMISQKVVNEQYWMHASLKDWADIAQQLQVAGILQIETVGNQVIYSMNDTQVEKLAKHFRGN